MRGAVETSGPPLSPVDREAQTRARHPLRQIRWALNVALARLDARFEKLYPPPDISDAWSSGFVFGVIGVNEGPADDGVLGASGGIGSRNLDVACGEEFRAAVAHCGATGSGPPGDGSRPLANATTHRAHLVQGKWIKQIWRELKVACSAEAAFKGKRSVRRLPKLGPGRSEPDRPLAATTARDVATVFGLSPGLRLSCASET